MTTTKRDAAEVGELAARIIDRLRNEFPQAHVEDAILIVELTDPQDEDTTLVLLECTSDRTTVREGLLQFAIRNGSKLTDIDDEDTE